MKWDKFEQLIRRYQGESASIDDRQETRVAETTATDLYEPAGESIQIVFDLRDPGVEASLTRHISAFSTSHVEIETVGALKILRIYPGGAAGLGRGDHRKETLWRT